MSDSNPDTVKIFGFELEQPSPLSLYGGVMLIFLLALMGVFNLSDAVEGERLRSSELKRELTALQNVEAQTIWTTRAQETSDLREDWNALIWQASSPGIAATEIDSSLREISKLAGMQNTQIQVAPVTTERNGLNLIRFEISGGISSSQIPRLLVSLAVSRKKLVTDDVRITTRNSTVTTIQLSGVAPFRESLDRTE